MQPTHISAAQPPTASELEIGGRPPSDTPREVAATGFTPSLTLPMVTFASALIHAIVLGLASLLPAPPEAIGAIAPEITFDVYTPPTPEPVVEPEPPPPEPVAAAEPPPAVERRRPPPPPAPILTATEDAVGTTEWAHPAGEEGGELGGQVGGEVGGDPTATESPIAPVDPGPRGVSRAELRRLLLGYIRGDLSRFINGRVNYPIAARREHVEGVVVLRLRIDEDGRVLGVRLSRTSGHEVLD
ncbi:MAG: energy transducer TonB, partial [Sandaracinaceae bacterium]